VQEDEIGELSSTHVGDEKMVQKFDRKTSREETTCIQL